MARDFVILTNPNNFAVKTNYTIPLYAHFDREKYIDNNIEKHKCILHVDTLIEETSFSSSAFIIQNRNDILAQVTNENDYKLQLQDDANPRVDVTGIKINATYMSDTASKSKTFIPNKDLTCSNYLKVHEDLPAFDDEDSEVQTNE